MKTPTLITIPFSHFCEKARWALEHARVPFREAGYLPGLHLRATKRVGARTVPVLVTERDALFESTDIVRYADERAPSDRRLLPDEHRGEILSLVDRFDRELGPATRLLAYHHLLPNPALLVKSVAASRPAAERLRMRVLLPLVGPIIRRRLGISDESAARARDTVRRVLADVGERLSRGYLVGGRFTAADLTFAALASPAVLPRGHALYANDARDLPPALRELVDEARATAAGQHAARMYAAHRV